MLVQVHWVNSPFTDLKFSEKDVHDENGVAHIRIASEPELGLFLNPEHFQIETKTKSRGVLRAEYRLVGEEPRPVELQQVLPKSVLRVSDIEFSVDQLNGRSLLKKFSISVGEKNPVPYATVEVHDCHNETVSN
jgi:hypothetical protein